MHSPYGLYETSSLVGVNYERILFVSEKGDNEEINMSNKYHV